MKAEIKSVYQLIRNADKNISASLAYAKAKDIASFNVYYF